jgi:hypothetical protein
MVVAVGFPLGVANSHAAVVVVAVASSDQHGLGTDSEMVVHRVHSAQERMILAHALEF